MSRRLNLVLFLAVRALLVHADEIRLIKSGHYEGTVDSYRIGATFYLSANEAARIYGGHVYWYAVSGRVQLSMRGIQVGFQSNSDQAKVGAKTVQMAYPVLARMGKAFIPIDFFTADEFSDAAAMKSKFDPKARLLSLSPMDTVGPLKWSSQADHTRIVLAMKEGLSYAVDRKGGAGIEVSIPQGTLGQAQKENIEDGLVAYASLAQESKRARLLVKLNLRAVNYRVLELAEPRRLVIDIARPASAPPLAQDKFSARAPAGLDAGGDSSTQQPPEDGPAPAIHVSTPPAEPVRSLRHRIAIDPGHGGRDTGASGRHGTFEKDINLAVARDLAARLKERGAFDVILTRGSDVFIPLGDRSRIANEFGADLFVSIHCNANSRKSESGFEIYFLSERASDPEAERLAEFENSVLSLEGKDVSGASGLLYALAKTEFINDASQLAGFMAKSLSKRVDLADRGVKQAAFYVLRGANEPAVLVEMGFISNSRDEGKLRSKTYRRRIVDGLYAGIQDFARNRDWIFSGKRL